MEKGWNLFERRFYRFWKESHRGKALLLAASGGRDSQVMLELFARLQKKMDWRLVVAHVHHGFQRKENHRNRASLFVQEQAALRGLDFKTNPEGSSALSSSEQDLRNFRRKWLFEWQQELACDQVVFAQHQRDQLETRLLHLIRGTGVSGLMAMKLNENNIWRPFLKTSIEEMADYLTERKLSWKEDPSNKETQYLRNWLRQNWLPMLEKKRSGSLKALERSLENLAESHLGTQQKVLNEPCLSRQDYLCLHQGSKLEAIAQLFRAAGFRQFRRSHLEEVLKRLDKTQKNLNFKVGGAQWLVSPGDIRVIPRSKNAT